MSEDEFRSIVADRRSDWVCTVEQTSKRKEAASWALADSAPVSYYVPACGNGQTVAWTFEFTEVVGKKDLGYSDSSLAQKTDELRFDRSPQDWATWSEVAKNSGKEKKVFKP